MDKLMLLGVAITVISVGCGGDQSTDSGGSAIGPDGEEHMPVDLSGRAAMEFMSDPVWWVPVIPPGEGGVEETRGFVVWG
jgi:hypothetical protein